MGQVDGQSEPVVAIVVAAGSGVRLGASGAGGLGPKALRMLGGVSLLRRSVDRLIAGGATRCVVVCRPEHRELVRAVLVGVGVPVTLADGGATRQESVAHGLDRLPGERCIVLVHDAARPLVPVEVVARVVAAVRGGAQAVVPVVPVSDSIRAVDQVGSRPVDRSTLRAVQTPQGFEAELLCRAHRSAAAQDYTDDAAVCEALGARVELVEGSPLSMKITRPLDFVLAESLVGLEQL